MNASISLRILVIFLSVLPLCQQLAEGAALDYTSAVEMGKTREITQGGAGIHLGSEREKREGESGEISSTTEEQNSTEAPPVDPLAVLKTGILVLKKETYKPVKGQVQLDNAFKSMGSVCTLVDIASNLRQPTNSSELTKILSAVKLNACEWMKNVFGSELDDGHGGCSLEKMELLCTTQQLYFLAVSATRELRNFNRVAAIDIAEWKQTHLPQSQ